MATINKPNIFSEYCPSVLIQGMQCPSERKGENCKRGHRHDEVFPNKCTHERGLLGCKNRYDKTPLICKCVHEGETKQELADRLGFDPEHIKYNNYSAKQVYDAIVDLKKDIEKLKEKAIGLNHSTATDKAFVKRINRAIHHLKIKKIFLNDLLYRKTDDEIQQEMKDFKDDYRAGWCE